MLTHSHNLSPPLVVLSPLATYRPPDLRGLQQLRNDDEYRTGRRHRWSKGHLQLVAAEAGPGGDVAPHGARLANTRPRGKLTNIETAWGSFNRGRITLCTSGVQRHARLKRHKCVRVGNPPLFHEDPSSCRRSRTVQARSRRIQTERDSGRAGQTVAPELATQVRCRVPRWARHEGSEMTSKRSQEKEPGWRRIFVLPRTWGRLCATALRAPSMSCHRSL